MVGNQISWMLFSRNIDYILFCKYLLFYPDQVYAWCLQIDMFFKKLHGGLMLGIYICIKLLGFPSFHCKSGYSTGVGLETHWWPWSEESGG
ncbi:hypothetical protein Tsubulata_004112 [Turnera subulata]|uniref:Uncharacterized protein n=1 Tax=Turnera subulata TaxID=218843 RepID=A0A9Q0FNT1_9ROSI|nr:hypothetical protein Tsubulata_004112 [Turnera subulata]